MTTRVKLECPDNSHWHVKVTVQAKKYDHAIPGYVPGEYTDHETFTLKQGESRETYIHDSNRLIVEEIIPE